MKGLTVLHDIFWNSINDECSLVTSLPGGYFADADVAAPTAARCLRWDGTSATKTLVSAAASSGVAATDTPMWEMFVQLKAYAKDRYIRGVGGEGGAGRGTRQWMPRPTVVLTSLRRPWAGRP